MPPLKTVHKTADVLQPADERYLFDAEEGTPQQAFRTPHAQVPKVPHRRAAGFVFEELSQSRR